MLYTRRPDLLIFAASVLLLGACDRNETVTLFELLPPGATGITFVNELPEDPEFNILNYLYYYNGGGVAVGDVDDNGLPDLYFTSNLGSNRLYLNRGDYVFEDVTDRAGVPGSEGWTTGVTMADVDGDGHTDIYVSAVSYLTMQGHNILYMNQGDGTFADRTAELGLEHVGYSTQALFFDYDGDGDLDMYLLNHSTHTERMITANMRRDVRHATAGDRLFRNDGARFTDVSEGSGIYSGAEGYGLGVVASDVNLDGCIDLYVANDFQENDFLYLNNCDGTFSESLTRAMGHTSRFSMGVDAADFDNDARPDMVVVDMLPAREEILKTSANAESFNLFDLRIKAGYHPQYARNTLQLNRGAERFSDIGYLAGVYATDWSWAPLFADLDNDGRKDLFVTNGIFRRPNDLDYINYVGNEAVQASLEKGITAENLEILSRMPQIPLANYAYQNNGDLTFTDRAEAWGLAEPGFSNGAVYVDLNNSGALDLVVSNINAPASIYRNRAREIAGGHYLTLRLTGADRNTAGIGAKVLIKHGGTTQMLEQMPTRGFQSSVDPRLHFGLGAATRIDTLTVIWPDQRFQVLTDVAADQTLELSQDDAVGRYAYHHAGDPIFEDVTERVNFTYTHTENVFFDYNREPLMPHRLSNEGPAMAVADVDGDGLDDLFVGGAKWQTGKLFRQRADGSFHPTSETAFRADSLHEDVDAAFFDANGDGHPDLYVVSGGNEFWGEQEPLRDRLYLNDGTGGFERATEALPSFFENGSCVAPGDYDGDGDVDLFVGSRVVSQQYGITPRSHLLRNDGSGHFVDVTDEVAPGLAQVGMVSSATWVGSSAGGALDLIVVGEWMPVTVFKQENGRFANATEAAGLGDTEGWWNSVSLADVNADGRDDLVLGNLGLNSYIRASATEPARLYIHDFAGNGSLQQILTFFKDGVSYPMAGRDELARLIPRLRSRYPSYADFGASRIEEIFSDSDLSEAVIRNARVFTSSIAFNNGDGTYRLRPLPTEAQFAPIYAALADDYDRDGHTDLIVAGNFFGVTPVRGRYDASYGLLLRGRNEGAAAEFQAVGLENSGLVIEGEVRAMQPLRLADGSKVIVIARNDDSLRIVRATRTDQLTTGVPGTDRLAIQADSAGQRP